MTGDVRPVLVGLLAEHAYRPGIARGVERCTCGASAVGDPGWHPRHQADVIASAGVVVATSEVERVAGEWESWMRVAETPRIKAFRDAAETLRALVAGARGGAQ